MAKMFDPRKLLRQISNTLLRAFFAQLGELQDLPWEQLKETQMEEVFAAWQQLPGAKRKQVQVILQDLAELSDERGLKVIFEEVNRNCPDRLPELMSLEARLDKGMWFYLNLPEVFEEAALFARTDAMATGRYAVRRNGLPTDDFEVSAPMIESLQEGLQNHYWPTEMRGRHCKVEHYVRGGQAHYFFAYLDNWPDRQLVFEDDGQMEPRSERYAFSNVFVYCPQDGSLELIARGGQDVHAPLQQAFCKAMFTLDVEPADPLRPVYKLDMLLDPNFTYPTESADRIKLVRLSRIRLDPISNSRELDYLELKFPPRISRQQWLEILFRELDCHGLTRSQVVVKQASIQLQFMTDSQGREKRMTFNTSIPNTCDLKSRPDDVRLVGERCLRLWEAIND